MPDNGARPEEDARRFLLAGLVDYAGLFPPAALEMPDAVRKYHEYRRGARAWALGKFVVPVARMREFGSAALPLFASGDPWPLTAIAGADFGADVATIADFVRRAEGRAAVLAIEVRAGDAAAVRSIAAYAAHAAQLAAALATPPEIFVEVPIDDDPSPLIGAIAAHALRAKVRTGGVERGAFPSAAQLARFIHACVAYGVTFKATAGLHHAIRGDYPLTYDRASDRATMFGFLNVFLAALFVRDGLAIADTIALLEERDSHAFGFSAAAVSWRGRSVVAPSVRASRAHAAASFGSCSFIEPVAELAGLGLV